MVTRPNLNSCTKPIFISCRSVFLLGIHWHSLKLYVLQLHWFRSSYKQTHQPSKVIKVSTKGKVQEFITLHFLRIWGCLKEFLGKLKNNSELQCLDQEHLGVKYNHMLWKEIWVMSYNSKNWDHIYYTCTIIIKCNQLKDFSMYVL